MYVCIYIYIYIFVTCSEGTNHIKGEANYNRTSKMLD